MECTHCGADNLMGAMTCIACSRSLFDVPADARPVPASQPAAAAAADPERPWLTDAPPPRTYGKIDHGYDALQTPTPAPVPPPPTQSTGGGLCSVCLAPLPLDAPAPVEGRAVCEPCQNLASPEELAENDVHLHPATGQEIADPEAQFRESLGSSKARPRARQPKPSLRVAPILVLVGLFLCLVTGAVVVFQEEPNRIQELMTGTEERAATLRLLPEEEHLVSLEVRTELSFSLEVLRAKFQQELEPTLVVDQTSIQTAEIAFAERVDDIAFADLTSKVRVERQSGVSGGKEIADRRLHEWDGYSGRRRLVLHDQRVPDSDDGALGIGRDLPPFATLTSIGGAHGPVAPGKTWTHEIALPVGVTKRGRTLTLRYLCKFRYVGTKTVAGRASVVVHAHSTGPSETPGDLDDMNRRSGGLEGVLFFDAESGMLVQANVDARSVFQRHEGRLQSQLETSARVDIRRR